MKKIYSSPDLEKLTVISEGIMLFSGEEETETTDTEENDNTVDIKRLLGL